MTIQSPRGWRIFAVGALVATAVAVAAIGYATWQYAPHELAAKVSVWLVKVLVTGKALKIAGAILLAIVAAVVAVRERRRHQVAVEAGPAVDSAPSIEPPSIEPPPSGSPEPTTGTITLTKITSLPGRGTGRAAG